MTDESAKLLAEAMNRLAAAIEKLAPGAGSSGGLQVFHYGFNQPQANVNPYIPYTHPYTHTY